MTPAKIDGINNITISGRIASGTTTLARNLAEKIGWEVIEGGALFEKHHDELLLHENEVNKRPDEMDLQYEEMIKKILREDKNHIIQSHLAGFDAQGIPGVFKILVICESEGSGADKLDIRIDRLANRKGISIEEAKEEVTKREKNNLEKWRRLYADNDPNWVYWDRKYYDLVVNTYSHNAKESLVVVLEALKLDL